MIRYAMMQLSIIFSRTKVCCAPQVHKSIKTGIVRIVTLLYPDVISRSRNGQPIFDMAAF